MKAHKGKMGNILIIKKSTTFFRSYGNNKNVFLSSHSVPNMLLTEERKKRCVTILSVLLSIEIMLQPIN